MRATVGVVWLMLAAGCGRGSLTGPSPTDGPMPAGAGIDWTMPADDLLTYLVPESGMVAVRRWPSGGVIRESAFVPFMQGDRLTLCMSGSCVHHQDFRVDDEWLYYVGDYTPNAWAHYSGRMGRGVGTRWGPRDWTRGLAWNWCGYTGDCPPCLEDTRECREANGYELIAHLSDGCGMARMQPSRSRNGVTWSGVRDWGGEIGARHTVRLTYASDAGGTMREEHWWLARGAGVVWWEDASGNTPGGLPATGLVPGAELSGFRVEEAKRCE